MKTPKPQPVTFHKGRYEVTMINENQTKFIKLYHVRLYDEAGTVATLSENELYKGMGAHIEIVVTLPIVWNSRKAPDFTETRAHIVAENIAFERCYTLYVPVEAVTIENVKDVASKCTGYTERYYTVAEFPAKFSKWYRHPFDRYAAKDAAEQLTKDAYDVLTYDEINTPQAQKYLSEFWQKVQDYAAEAARIKSMSEADYIAECLAAAKA